MSKFEQKANFRSDGQKGIRADPKKIDAMGDFLRRSAILPTLGEVSHTLVLSSERKPKMSENFFS
jgi:hypothetical protein